MIVLLLKTFFTLLSLGFLAVQTWLWSLMLKTPPTPTAENPPTWKEWLFLSCLAFGPVTLAVVCARVALTL